MRSHSSNRREWIGGWQEKPQRSEVGGLSCDANAGVEVEDEPLGPVDGPTLLSN